MRARARDAGGIFCDELSIPIGIARSNAQPQSLIKSAMVSPELSASYCLLVELRSFCRVNRNNILLIVLNYDLRLRAILA